MLTDFTEHPTGEGTLYLCAVKDACSNRIVGYSIDSRMTSQLAVNALTDALALRSAVDTIVHSDGAGARSCGSAAASSSEPGRSFHDTNHNLLLEGLDRGERQARVGAPFEGLWRPTG